jgi:hypothetical protein
MCGLSANTCDISNVITVSTIYMKC